MSNGRRQSNQALRINLALQGGGSHGAFTWVDNQKPQLYSLSNFNEAEGN